MLFAAYLALKGLKWQTIKTYLSTVLYCIPIINWLDPVHYMRAQICLGRGELHGVHPGHTLNGVYSHINIVNGTRSGRLAA